MLIISLYLISQFVLSELFPHILYKKQCDSSCDYFFLIQFYNPCQYCYQPSRSWYFRSSEATLYYLFTIWYHLRLSGTFSTLLGPSYSDWDHLTHLGPSHTNQATLIFLMQSPDWLPVDSHSCDNSDNICRSFPH